MSKRWKNRPQGANWGEFGDDNQRGRMNDITAERRLAAPKEVKAGQAFTLWHLLDKPRRNPPNAYRFEPVFHPVKRGKETYFNLANDTVDPRFIGGASDAAAFC